MRIPTIVVALMGAVATLSCTAAFGEEVRGAGSTFVYPAIWSWSQGFRTASGNIVGYQSVGSSAGVSRLRDNVVDFAATDRPLKPAELESLGLGQFPIVIGGVVPVVNIAGVGPGQMRLTGSILADIYLGKIKNWSDPALKALNPDIKLPNANIAVVFRSDGSGTTFNFVNYLSKVSQEWADKVGEGNSVNWPTGGGARGNGGVSFAVKQVANSIGYVEFSYVRADKLSYTLLQNQAGTFVAPDPESFQAAAATADWKNAPDFYLLLTNAPGANAYPITATTFILMYRQPRTPTRAKAGFDFWSWVLADGGSDATKLGYVPLPASLADQIEAYWAKTFRPGS
jgi:phosphate transport system substrate-binding protein